MSWLIVVCAFAFLPLHQAAPAETRELVDGQEKHQHGHGHSKERNHSAETGATTRRRPFPFTNAFHLGLGGLLPGQGASPFLGQGFSQLLSQGLAPFTGQGGLLFQNVQQQLLQSLCQIHDECASNMICYQNLCTPALPLVGTRCIVDNECQPTVAGMGVGCRSGICLMISVSPNLLGHNNQLQNIFGHYGGAGGFCTNGGIPLIIPEFPTPTYCSSIGSSQFFGQNALYQQQRQCPFGSICDPQLHICCTPSNSWIGGYHPEGYQNFPWQSHLPWFNQNNQHFQGQFPSFFQVHYPGSGLQYPGSQFPGSNNALVNFPSNPFLPRNAEQDQLQSAANFEQESGQLAGYE